MIRFLKVYVLMPLVIILLAFQEEEKTIIPVSQAGSFTNPLLPSGPDPWVEQKDGWYYVTHTTGKSLVLYRTKKMSDLGHAEVKTIWIPPATGMNSKNIWAPEIHYINNKWYFYYAADDGNNVKHRMWVLENNSEDPFKGTWVNKGVLQLPDNKWAIDGTAFEHNDQLFYLWSGWEGDVNVRQDIYITKMANPWTSEGKRILLTKPEYAWELKGITPTINEAPQFIAHNQSLYIIYSASGCWTDDYALGMLYADASSNIMDPTSWLKFIEPVFEKNPEGQAYGPGHNAFFKSPDGSQDWIIYHANPAPGQGCRGTRSPRMQQFTWSVHGIPDFGTPVKLGVAVDAPSGEK